MMISRVLGGITLILAILTPYTIYASDKKPLIVVISNWAPYKGEELPKNGIVTDVTKQALERAGYEISITVAPWKRALKGVIDGKYDVLPAVWYSPERATKIEYGDAVITSRMVIVNHVDYDFSFNSLEDLRGEIVGVAAGWGYPEDFQNADYILKDEAVDLVQSLRKIIYGRIKLAIVEEVAARYSAYANFKDAAGLLNYSETTLQEKNLHVAFSKKRADYKKLAADFNTALAAMRDDGSFDKTLTFHGVLASQ